MALFAVTTVMKTKGGDQVWYPFECPQFANIDELYMQLDSRGIARGYRLKVRREDNGFMSVVERDPIILGVDIVGQITVMNEGKIINEMA